MTLKSSGQLDLGGGTLTQSIQLETHAYGSNAGTAQISMNDTNVRNLAGIASGQISLSNFYGKTNPTQTVSFITPGTSGTWTVPPGVTSITVKYPVPPVLGQSGTLLHDVYGNPYYGAPYYETYVAAYLGSTTQSVTPGAALSYSIGAFNSGNISTNVAGTGSYTYGSSAATASSFNGITTTPFDAQIMNHAGNQDANLFVNGSITTAAGSGYNSSGYFMPALTGSPTATNYISVRNPWTGTSGKTTVTYVNSPPRYSNSSLQSGASSAGVYWNMTDQCCHGDLQGHLSARSIPTSLVNPLMSGDTWDASKATVYWRHVSDVNSGVNPASVTNIGRNGTSDWWYTMQTNENGYSESLCYYAIGFAMTSWIQVQY